LDRIDGALGNTLHQIYEDKKGLGYALYNDDTPDDGRREEKSTLSRAVDFVMMKAGLKESSVNAHAKGVVATDGQSGFWLVHSVPKFPDLRPPTFTWTADDTYGQTFLCMTMDADQIDKVGIQLQYMHIKTFDSNMPEKIGKAVPALKAVISGTRLAGTHVTEIMAVDGHTFTSFAKDATCKSDLYEEFVSQTLQVGFNWETWRRGGELPSICADKKEGTYDAINVMAMKIGDVEFGYTKDHAKIGVATSSSSAGGYVCVGDINRMESQRKRGGGTVCFKSRTLYKALAASITSLEDCK